MHCRAARTSNRRLAAAGLTCRIAAAALVASAGPVSSEQQREIRLRDGGQTQCRD
jgi:hypothetical protein